LLTPVLESAVICREFERAEMAERAEWVRYQCGGYLC
jgi:hypothetical protein